MATEYWLNQVQAWSVLDQAGIVVPFPAIRPYGGAAPVLDLSAARFLESIWRDLGVPRALVAKHGLANPSVLFRLGAGLFHQRSASNQGVLPMAPALLPGKRALALAVRMTAA